MAELSKKTAREKSEKLVHAPRKPPEKEPEKKDPVVKNVPAPKKAKLRSFLSFKLPSKTFRFDRKQRFEILPSLSRVGFDGKSTLHDFSGVTSKVSGYIDTNLAKPNEAATAHIEVRAKGLSTGLESRDSAMHDEHLEVGKYPKILFDLSRIQGGKADETEMTVTGNAVGKITIHGVTKDLEMPVHAKVDASRRLFIEGEAKIRFDEFGIKVPSKLGLVSMDPNVKIWITLRARAVSGKDK